MKQDDLVDEMARKYGISCFRGSESNVLKRFHDAAVKFKVDHIIRITGDCPLVDPLIVSKMIKLYFNGTFDYSATVSVPDLGSSPSHIGAYPLSGQNWSRNTDAVRIWNSARTAQHLSAHMSTSPPRTEHNLLGNSDLH